MTTATSSILFRRRGIAAGAVLSIAALVLAGCSNSGDEEAGGDAAANGDTCDISAEYPSGPIELVVPFAAGGGTDSVARLIAEELGSAMDAQINVVNRTGGGGVVGHQAIATANPNGQTIGLVTAELAMLHHLGLTDVSPESVTTISQMNADPAGLTVAADSEFESVSDVIDHARENPGDLVASGTAQAGIWHVSLAGMLLAEDVDADAIRWVPSEGAAPALQEVVAGGVDISTASLAENRTMIEAGRAKALGVMDEERAPGFDEVETLQEQGIDFSMGTWRGIAGPADMDEDIVAELECHLGQIAESEAYTTFMEDAGLGMLYRNAEEFATFAEEDDVTKGDIIREAGLAE
ncbi:tripartite tricarboxylate transporter substrate binding protein [Citricoccus muralis]|uniref:Tripartite tricarboxylate transporter substrate binding protein n=1 Tax=Citricoccus muralis TaxID=169134 RepID=A0ABY8H8S6_9MICC|nr:tripartite tricarboxylate transporter substrate binding protein [Citricoccus muralis]WFP17012.1 tripartite tricarboxylate transporter substrate binding protein [Citricoccus muralis]